MDIRSFLRPNILTPGSIGKVQTELESSAGLRNRVGGPRANTELGRRKESSARSSRLAEGDLRSVVARRFMRMNESHDRIRTQVLASRWQT
ncbi:MAG: hypothetical protein M3Y84_05450 [Acidobacteriota bacterium]|nr:hypothetical protein [Acidobacteriota bacterium]